MKVTLVQRLFENGMGCLSGQGKPKTTLLDVGLQKNLGLFPKDHCPKIFDPWRSRILASRIDGALTVWTMEGQPATEWPALDASGAHGIRAHRLGCSNMAVSYCQRHRCSPPVRRKRNGCPPVPMDTGY